MLEINNSELRKLLTQKHMKSEDLLINVKKYHESLTSEEKSHYKEIIFENNIKMIYKIASKRCYGLPGLTFEDAFQWGAVGFCDGLERFDLTRDTQFSTYITWWIDKYVLDYFYSSQILYVPKNVIREYRKYNKLINDYLKTHDHKQLDGYIDKKIRTENPDWDRFKRRHLDPYSRVSGNNVVSIEGYHDSDEENPTLEGLIPDKSIPDTLENMADSNMIEKIDKIMRKYLNSNEYFVIKYRYFGDEFLKLDDIASKIFKDDGSQVTRERIRQLEESALNKIKRQLVKLK